jgi:hypothetical protein
MKRSLLLFLLAAGCCLSSGCRSQDQATGGAGDARRASGGDTAGAKPAKADVVFAREAVEGLLGGDTGVAGAFDWENLRVPGAADAGEAYSEMPDEERAEFQKGFIEKFSESFKQSGASASDLKNWREQAKEGDRTIVAVDTTTGKTMHVTVVRRDGRQLVSDLSID